MYVRSSRQQLTHALQQLISYTLHALSIVPPDRRPETVFRAICECICEHSHRQHTGRTGYALARLITSSSSFHRSRGTRGPNSAQANSFQCAAKGPRCGKEVLTLFSHNSRVVGRVVEDHDGDEVSLPARYLTLECDLVPLLSAICQDSPAVVRSTSACGRARRGARHTEHSHVEPC